MFRNYYHFNFQNNVKWMFSGGTPRVIDKTLTGAFPLAWQDGIGGDLVDYSITGASGGVGDYGGKRNQLVVNGNFESLRGWGTDNVVFTVSNNEATLVSNYSGSGISQIYNGDEYIGRKILFKLSAKTNDSGYVENLPTGVTFLTDGEWHEYCWIATITYNWFAVSIKVPSGTCYIKNCNLIDLSEMFGAGQEPTDVTTAKSRIAEVMGGQQEYYPYDAGTDYYKIPEVVTSGGCVDLGTLNWNKDSTVGGTVHAFYAELENGKRFGWNNVGNAYLYDYTTSSPGRVDYGYDDKSVSACDDNGNIWIYNSAYNDLTTEEFKSAMSGKHYYYQRATDESWYIQNKTIYRTTQLTANQTIRKTTDGLPNFTDLPTGYLQMGVDTEVQPSGGSVTYKSRRISV